MLPEKWQQVLGSLGWGENRRGSGNIAFVMDISDIKAWKNKKNALIGIASHELKTPVTSIKAYAELLKEMLEVSQEKETLPIATKLNGQVDRLTKLVQSLLDTTKISEGQLVLQKEWFDFNELVKEQVEEMQRVSTQHEMKMHLASLKPVYADRERLAQV